MTALIYLIILSVLLALCCIVLIIYSAKKSAPKDAVFIPDDHESVELQKELSKTRDDMISWKIRAERAEKDLEDALTDYDTLSKKFDEICDEADALEAKLRIEHKRRLEIEKDVFASKMKADMIEKQFIELKKTKSAAPSVSEAASVKRKPRRTNNSDKDQLSFMDFPEYHFDNIV